jgi:hypothetical protein
VTVNDVSCVHEIDRGTLVEFVADLLRLSVEEPGVETELVSSIVVERDKDCELWYVLDGVGSKVAVRLTEDVGCGETESEALTLSVAEVVIEATEDMDRVAD